jgi:hypothetical protein
VNHYEAKQEARRERLLARAEKLDRISSARFDRARAEVAGIPFGQPILVGHHSEGKHRAALKRQDQNMRKAVEAGKAAERARGAAYSVGSAGISSDDPDAPDKLAEKLAKLEATQAMMVAANKVVRAFYKHGNRAENSDEELARYFEKLAAAGITSKNAARELLKPSWGTHVGFEAYQLSNNNARIAQVKARMATLARKPTEDKVTEIGNHGIKVVENAEANRLQIIFPGKPDAETRSMLKSRGFRWAPSEGAWQRHLGNSARWAAEEVVKKLATV